MAQPENETEDLLLSITKNCEMLIEKIQRKAEETLELKMIKPRETFYFNPPIQIEGDWMIGLTRLNVYNSIKNITEKSKKFEQYTDSFDNDISFTELKDKVAEVLGLSDISTEHLEHEIYGPKIIKTYRKISTEKSQTDGYYIFLINYMHSSFRDFKSYLRILSSLDETDIQLILKRKISKFITNKILPGVYVFKSLSEFFSRGFENDLEIGKLQPNHIHDRSSSIFIESENITLIIKLILRYEIKDLRFDKRSFLNTILGFSPYWDHKKLIGRCDEYYSKKNKILIILIKIHLKYDVFDGSVLNGIRRPFFYSFVFDNPPGYKVFSKRETIHYKKMINKSNLKTITFFLEDDNHKKNNFNQETLTFTLQVIKI